MCASWCAEAAKGAEDDGRKTQDVWRSYCPPHIPKLSLKPHRACTQGRTEQKARVRVGQKNLGNLLSLLSFLMAIPGSN